METDPVRTSNMDEHRMFHLEHEVLFELNGKVNMIKSKLDNLKRQEQKAEILGESYDPTARIQTEQEFEEASEKLRMVTLKISADRARRKEENERKKREEIEQKIAKEKAEAEERRQRAQLDAERRKIEYERYLVEREETLYIMFKTNTMTEDYYLILDGKNLLDKFCNRVIDETLGDKCMCPDCGIKMVYLIDDEKRRRSPWSNLHHKELSNMIADEITCNECKIKYNSVNGEYMKSRGADSYGLPHYMRYDPTDPDGSITKTKLASLTEHYMRLEQEMVKCRAEIGALGSIWNAL